MTKSDAAAGIPCTWMRGGTSKGLFFLASDLPANPEQRDALLLSIMGSPDTRQIDGVGGGDPLTSKVAIVSPASRPDVDIEYLFLQVFVDQPVVTDAQNCGNILSGVCQFAIEQQLLTADSDETAVKVFLVNSDQVATVTIQTPGGVPVYDGDFHIDGVPGPGAPVLQNFPDAAGSSCGALLPSGRRRDTINGIDVTLIDNGMPVVVLRADAMGISGYESRDELDANKLLQERLEAIRLQAGGLMNLGDVTRQSVPKMTMVTAPGAGGQICSRTFIPHRCHASIGVLGAVSVATAAAMPGTVAFEVARLPEAADKRAGAISISVEHPSGETSVVVEMDADAAAIDVRQAAIVRTARKLFSGRVFPRLPAC